MRAGLLVVAGALSVHELRYALAAHAQDAHAHAYMGWVVPLTCALLALGVVEVLARLAFRAGHSPPPGPPAAGTRWLAISALLAAIFCAQEVAELLLTHGRVELAESLVHHGGWLAGPLSLAAGAAIALLLRGARTLLSRARARAKRRSPAAREPRRALASTRRPRVPVIACHLAGRAPPPLVI
jgi:hypothetical protein